MKVLRLTQQDPHIMRHPIMPLYTMPALYTMPQFTMLLSTMVDLVLPASLAKQEPCISNVNDNI